MKKGFTLAELLGVIIILGLVGLISLPAVTESLNHYKNKLCNTQVSYMISAAKNWGSDHLLELPDEEETKTIKVSDLIKQGYLNGDSDATNENDKLKIVNPSTKEYFSPDPVITITKKENQFIYTIDNTTINSCN